MEWTAPDDHGEAITGYTVTLSPATGTALVKNVAGDVTSASFDELTPGVSYTATVSATNAGGQSPVSAVSNAVTVPAVVPAAPSGVIASPSVTSVTVGWTPEFDGGSAITGYTVRVYEGDTVVASTVADADATSTVIGGLERVTDYSVTVTAENALGSSEESARTQFSTTATVPARPDAPLATPVSDTEITLTWAAPDNGGSEITGYSVAVLQGGNSLGVLFEPTTAITVGDLLPGTSYTFTVTAANAEGRGETSPESAPVRTFSVPGTTTVNAALQGSNGISASWSVPSDNGGTAIVGYTAQLVSGGAVIESVARDAETTNVEFADLDPGQSYLIRVISLNRIGESAPSDSSAVVIPAVAPDAPAAPVVAQGPNGDSLLVSWAPPASDGGAAISSYIVTVYQDGVEVASATVEGTVTSTTVNGFEHGTYTATVTATNSAGSNTSPQSQPITVAGPAPLIQPEPITDEDIAEGDFPGFDASFSGLTVTVDLGSEYANQWVGITVNSTPRFLGWFLTDADGVVTLTLPADLEVGDHHLVAYSSDGEVVGVAAFELTAAPDNPDDGEPSSTPVAKALPNTGAESLAPAGIAAALLMLLGGAAAFIARRRQAQNS